MNTKKLAVYEQLARMGKAVASPRRLELLDLLSQAPRTVEALAEQTEQTVANVSQHLQVLRAARMVEAEKKGLYVTYRLADEQVGAFYRSLRALAEARSAEMRAAADAYLAAPDDLAPIERDVLVRRLKRGDVTLLDVRPVEEFRAGHLPGAISMPLDQLKKHLRELPKSREVVAYCRGPYCAFAVEAVKLLRARGFSATRFEDGVPEWRASGQRVEVSS